MDIMVSENDYIMHYGVKGMKWGVRKASKNPRTKWGERRKVTNEHNQRIKDRWNSVKNDPNASVAEYKAARNARYKNLAGRFLASGIVGKSAQGQYYQYRDSGETKAKALLKTAARRLPTRVAFNAAVTLGAGALGLTSVGIASDIYRRNKRG